MRSHQPSSGRRSPTRPLAPLLGKAMPMDYSFTQISNYLRCPRSYRYRYLDGWREKETRAAMVFGRCFENALGAYFRGEDCGATLPVVGIQNGRILGSQTTSRNPSARTIRAG